MWYRKIDSDTIDYLVKMSQIHSVSDDWINYIGQLCSVSDLRHGLQKTISWQLIYKVVKRGILLIIYQLQSNCTTKKISFMHLCQVGQYVAPEVGDQTLTKRTVCQMKEREP